MSFFLPGRLRCFLCNELVATRREAALLLYARPDEVGEFAKHGRSWVHRACWNSWDMRERWAASALQLMAAAADTVVVDGVACQRSAKELLLVDPIHALSLAIPLPLVSSVRSCLRDGGAVQLGATEWRFEKGPHKTRVLGQQQGEIFEELYVPNGHWGAVLEAVLRQSPQP